MLDFHANTKKLYEPSEEEELMLRVRDGDFYGFTASARYGRRFRGF
jgi:hypothetical protein